MMDLVVPEDNLEFLSESNKSHLRQLRTLAVQISREYPYHCIAYGLFALRYLVPSSLDLAYELGYALFNYPALRAIFGLLTLSALATAWQKRKQVLSWLSGQRVALPDNFPSLKLDLPEDFSQFRQDLVSEKTTANGLTGPDFLEVGGSYISTAVEADHLLSKADEELSKKLDSSAKEYRNDEQSTATNYSFDNAIRSIQGDVDTEAYTAPQLPIIVEKQLSMPIGPNKCGMAALISSTPRFSPNRRGDSLPEIGAKSLENWGTVRTNSSSGLSTDLFPAVESDICLIPEKKTDSVTQLPSHLLEFDGWVTFDGTQARSNAGSSTPPHPDVPGRTQLYQKEYRFPVDIDDTQISYVHYKSPSPDSSSVGSNRVDVVHQCSGRSSSISIMADVNAHGMGSSVEVRPTTLDLEEVTFGDMDSDFTDPEIDLIPLKHEFVEASTPYKDTQREEFLAHIQTVFNTVVKGSSETPVILVEPSMSQSWLGSFSVRKGLRWRKCNVVLANDSLDVSLTIGKGHGKNVTLWQYPLWNTTIQICHGMGCRRGYSHRVKLSAPPLPEITLKASDDAVKNEFLNLVENYHTRQKTK